MATKAYQLICFTDCLVQAKGYRDRLIELECMYPSQSHTMSTDIRIEK